MIATAVPAMPVDLVGRNRNLESLAAQPCSEQRGNLYSTWPYLAVIDKVLWDHGFVARLRSNCDRAVGGDIHP